MEDILPGIVKAAENKNAQNPVVLDIRNLSVVADFFVVCHGNSERQVQTIAEEIQKQAQQMDVPTKRMEGYQEARWVLIDLDDIVVHVFHKEERDFYHLEKLWADADHVQIKEA